MTTMRRIGAVVLVAGGLVAGALVAPAPAPAQDACDPSYPDLCLPAYGYDAFNCSDIDAGGFAVLAPDVNGLDADHDGIGCESN